jgi:NAD(P)H-hydrate epimerase
VPEDLKQIVRQYWRVSPLTVVVDASALAWLPQENIAPGLLRVITPHPGEAARLLDLSTKEVQADRIQALRSLSKRFGDTWVVLKGHQTLIGRSTGEILINSSGNPHLAQGGSGDVLSGYIAGLVAQPSLRSDPLKTICYAVWQHGATADRLQQTRSNWVVEDLLEELGRTGER